MSQEKRIRSVAVESLAISISRSYRIFSNNQVYFVSRRTEYFVTCNCVKLTECKRKKKTNGKTWQNGNTKGAENEYQRLKILFYKICIHIHIIHNARIKRINPKALLKEQFRFATCDRVRQPSSSLPVCSQELSKF